MTESKKRKVYESTQKATLAWRKKFMKQINIEFHIERDAEVIAKLQSVPNKTDYIRQLVLADIAKERKGQEMSEQKFTIKPEYYEDFGSEADEDTVIDMEEIERLAQGWGKSIGEVLNMLEPCDR